MTSQRDRLADILWTVCHTSDPDLRHTERVPLRQVGDDIDTRVEWYLTTGEFVDVLLARGVRVGRYCEPTCGCGGTSKFYQCMGGEPCLMCDYDLNAAPDGD